MRLQIIIAMLLLLITGPDLGQKEKTEKDGGIRMGGGAEFVEQKTEGDGGIRMGRGAEFVERTEGDGGIRMGGGAEGIVEDAEEYNKEIYQKLEATEKILESKNDPPKFPTWITSIKRHNPWIYFLLVLSYCINSNVIRSRHINVLILFFSIIYTLVTRGFIDYDSIKPKCPEVREVLLFLGIHLLFNSRNLYKMMVAWLRPVPFSESSALETDDPPTPINEGDRYQVLPFGNDWLRSVFAWVSSLIDIDDPPTPNNEGDRYQLVVWLRPVSNWASSIFDFDDPPTPIEGDWYQLLVACMQAGWFWWCFTLFLIILNCDIMTRDLQWMPAGLRSPSCPWSLIVSLLLVHLVIIFYLLLLLWGANSTKPEDSQDQRGHSTTLDDSANADPAQEELTQEEPTRDESAQDDTVQEELTQEEPTRDESAQTSGAPSSKKSLKAHIRDYIRRKWQPMKKR